MILFAAKIYATKYIGYLCICKKHIKNMADLDKEKGLIRSAMQSQGTYSEDLELSILACAGSLRKHLTLISDITKLKKSFVIEKSREGNKAYKLHPAFAEFSKSSDDLRKALDSVGLSLRTLYSAKGDEVDELINEVTNAGNDE